MARAADVLESAEAELSGWSPGDIRLSLRGVDHFHHSVLYTRMLCDHDYRFMDAVQHLRACVLEAGEPPFCFLLCHL